MYLGKVIKMKERIKELRKEMNLSQEKFGELVGVTRSHVASMENGKALASKRVIKEIASKCNVNEEWIEFGTGKKEKQMTKADELAYLMGKFLAEGDEFKTKIIKAMLSLEDDEWRTIEKLVDKIIK